MFEVAGEGHLIMNPETKTHTPEAARERHKDDAMRVAQMLDDIADYEIKGGAIIKADHARAAFRALAIIMRQTRPEENT